MRVLTVNAGSSSLKLRLLSSSDELLATHDLSPGPAGAAELSARLDELRGRIDVVGHRIVHGGRDFPHPLLVDPDVRRRLGELVDLAPLHQPVGLAELDLVSELVPHVPAVACFDTAFHATLPPAAATYAIPAEWRERYGIRRYGFHGLAHSAVTRRVAELTGGMPERLVVCHLGSGASLAAVHRGRSVDTTMGFTPLEGLVMATRSGSVDPGLVLWLQTNGGLSAEDVDTGLNRRGGLAALAGTADMRAVIAAAHRDEPTARLGLDVYLHRLRAGIAAMTAALGGIDALTFSGGVGEHAPEIREAAASGLGYLGIRIDSEANATATSPDAEITAPDTHVRTFVVTAREDREIADAAREVVRRQAVDALAT